MIGLNLCCNIYINDNRIEIHFMLLGLSYRHRQYRYRFLRKSINSKVGIKYINLFNMWLSIILEATIDPRDWYDDEPGFDDSYGQDETIDHALPHSDEEDRLNEEEESVLDQSDEDDTVTAQIDETETNLIGNDAVTEEQLEVRYPFDNYNTGPKF